MKKKILELFEKLKDERSKKVLFVSHCFLNENTRYFGGAFCHGVHPDIVKEIASANFGIVQMPCPEQLVWGGVLKKLIWLPAATKGRWIYYIFKITYPFFIMYTYVRYSRLASKIVSLIKDYVKSGFTVVGIAGIDGSPTCGVNTTLNMKKSFDYIAGMQIATLKREDFNRIMFTAYIQQGKGIFIKILSQKLKKNNLDIKLSAHNIIDEIRSNKVSFGLDK